MFSLYTAGWGWHRQGRDQEGIRRITSRLSHHPKRSHGVYACSAPFVTTNGVESIHRRDPSAAVESSHRRDPSASAPRPLGEWGLLSVSGSSFEVNCSGLESLRQPTCVKLREHIFHFFDIPEKRYLALRKFERLNEDKKSETSQKQDKKTRSVIQETRDFQKNMQFLESWIEKYICITAIDVHGIDQQQ